MNNKCNVFLLLASSAIAGLLINSVFHALMIFHTCELIINILMRLEINLLLRRRKEKCFYSLFTDEHDLCVLVRVSKCVKSHRIE